MRILKYRAYIKPLKRYAEKYETILYHHQCNMKPSWTVNISPEEYYGDEDLVIEQFTGLLDRNDKEIYDGDILKSSHPVTKYGKQSEDIRYYRVYWEDYKFRWEYRRCSESGGTLAAYSSESLDIYCGDWEIIGNIHENPELLRGEE